MNLIDSRCWNCRHYLPDHDHSVGPLIPPLCIGQPYPGANGSGHYEPRGTRKWVS